jgi:hypothetical protein
MTELAFDPAQAGVSWQRGGTGLSALTMRDATWPVQPLSVFASDGSSAMTVFTGLAEARPPEMAAIWSGTACVLGGSIAGRKTRRSVCCSQAASAGWNAGFPG